VTASLSRRSASWVLPEPAVALDADQAVGGLDARHPGGQSFGQALGGALQLLVQGREVDRDLEFVGQEAAQ
jgi:hypothetical protein